MRRLLPILLALALPAAAQSVADQARAQQDPDRPKPKHVITNADLGIPPEGNAPGQAPAKPRTISRKTTAEQEQMLREAERARLRRRIEDARQSVQRLQNERHELEMRRKSLLAEKRTSVNERLDKTNELRELDEAIAKKSEELQFAREEHAELTRKLEQGTVLR
jgi:vacuolar-type H+-ATPase subunit I/STV1